MPSASPTARRSPRFSTGMVNELGLRPVGAGQWHVFPPPGGITGMLLLAESHLTVHTFPEHRSLCLNLFCCTPRPAWPFAERLAEMLGAERVRCGISSEPTAAWRSRRSTDVNPARR